MSRYQSSLEVRMRDAESTREQWLARLQLMGYLARRGMVGELASTCATARQLFVSAGDPLIYAYINFAEAMRDYFEHGFDPALDKLRRVDALCVADVGKDELPMIVKGWLAHISRIRSDWVALEAYAIDACSVEHKRSSEGIARIAIVLADCLQQLRNYKQADAWYAEARGRANECGDELLVASIMYNRPSCRVFNLRIDELTLDLKSSARLTEIEAQSVSAFSQYIHDHSMQWALEWLHAQTNLLSGDFAGARRLLESQGLGKMDSDWPSAGAVRAADLVLCRSRLDPVAVDEISLEAEACISRVQTHSDPGDSAIAFRSLEQALVGINDDLSKRLSGLREAALEKYQKNLELQRACVDRIFDVIRGVDPRRVFARIDN